MSHFKIKMACFEESQPPDPGGGFINDYQTYHTITHQMVHSKFRPGNRWLKLSYFMDKVYWWSDYDPSSLRLDKTISKFYDTKKLTHSLTPNKSFKMVKFDCSIFFS